MKILYVTEFFPSTPEMNFTGGIEARTFFLARELGKKHLVTIIAAREIGKPEKQQLMNCLILRVGPTRMYSRGGQMINRIFFMLAVIRQGLWLDVDVIEAASFIAWLPTLLLSRIKRTPRVLVVADVVAAFANDEPFTELLHWYERKMLQSNWDQIICISNTVRKKLSSFDIVSRVETIYCGVDLDLIRSIKIRRKINFSIITVGRLVAYKQIDCLIKAVALLSKEYNWKLHIVGTGEQLSNLKELVKQLSLERKVIFHLHLGDYRKLLKLVKRSYVFCLPSIVEGFGIATLESLALGTPAIISATPVHKEITKGHGVVYFRPSSSENLAQKLGEIFADKSFYKRLQNSTKKIIVQYDWRKIANQTEKIYQRLCPY